MQPALNDPAPSHKHSLLSVGTDASVCKISLQSISTALATTPRADAGVRTSCLGLTIK